IRLWQAPRTEGAVIVERKRDTAVPIAATAEAIPEPDTITSAAQKWNGILIGADSKASWSADGSKAAFRSYPIGKGIKVYDVTTGTTSVVCVDGKDPAWSPAAPERLAFVKGRDRHEELWVKHGDAMRKIADGGFPCWLPDGRSVVWIT